MIVTIATSMNINKNLHRQNLTFTEITKQKVRVILLFTCGHSMLVLKKTDLLNDYKLQPRDIRFSALSSLYVRQSSIILRLQVNGWID